jgi:hypothetical protein
MPDDYSGEESKNDVRAPFFGASPRPYTPLRCAPLQTRPPSLSSTPRPPPAAPRVLMASKIIAPFAGPLMPAAIDEWLSQCEDGFAIYASTKTDKSPSLDIITQIRLTGTQLQEPSTAAWWNAGRKEFLKLPSWEAFEKKIRARFMPKGYQLIALRTFFLCSQGRLPFSEYAINLTEARNLAGTTIISPHVFKCQLLFHSHTVLLLRVMALPEFDIETIPPDDLISLMSMQWDSILAEGRPSIRGSSSVLTIPTPTHAPPTSTLPLLTDAERTCLTNARGCWRCRKSPGDPGWVDHVSRTCPGDTTVGLLPGRDFVQTKREPVGIILDTDDQPDHSEVEAQSPYPVDDDTDSK